MAKISCEIYILYNHDAARPQCLSYPGKRSSWIPEMSKQEPCVNEVEFRRRLALTDVGKSEFHVADSLFFGFVPRQPELDLVDIPSDDTSIGADEFGQIQGSVAAATANVEASHLRFNPDAIEQAERSRSHDARQYSQALSSLHAAPDYIVIVLHYAVSPIQFGSLLNRSPFYCKSLGRVKILYGDHDDYQIVYCYVEKDLTEDALYEVMLTQRLNDWSRMTRPARDAILRRVREGAGLVLLHPFVGGVRGHPFKGSDRHNSRNQAKFETWFVMLQTC
jgi:hypothetical protein